MSKPKKQKPAESSLYGRLETSGLSRDARAQVLLAAYLEYPAEISHQRRLRDLALRTGQTYNALLQVATRRGWKEALEATQGTPDAVEATEAGVLAVTAVEEVNRTFSALQMAAGIKAYAQVANETCASFTRTAQKLVTLWTRRIDAVLADVSDPATLDELTAQHLLYLWQQLQGIMEDSARYIAPAAQVQLLNAVGFTQSLPPDLPEDLVRNAFTMQGLQASLARLGVKPLMDDHAAAAAAFGAYPDLPDIEGRR